MVAIKTHIRNLLEDIHKAIANVGYDTDKIKAKDEVYKDLHKCCKYDRLTK